MPGQLALVVEERRRPPEKESSKARPESLQPLNSDLTNMNPATWQLATHQRHSLGMLSFSRASQIFQSFLALPSGSFFWDAGTSCTAGFL